MTLLEAFERYRRAELPEFALKQIDARGAEREYSQEQVTALVDKAARILLNRGVAKSDRVVLACASGSIFFICFWACQLIGAVAVPCKKPERETEHDALDYILRTSSPRAVVQDTLGTISNASCEVISFDMDELDQVDWIASPEQTVEADSLAVIQFTSGSTSDPMGCMLTHSAILANCDSIFSRSGGESGETCVHWVPLYHDMGLMGGVLAPVILQARTIIMDTRRFIVQPLSWLDVLAKHGHVHSSVSNFALAMVLKRAKRIKLDQNALSRVKNIFCGAEHIDAELVRDFNEALEPYGLPSDAVHPAYGLAELTLMATSRKAGIRSVTLGDIVESTGSISEDAQSEYVSVGIPLPGSEVHIVGSGGERLGEGAIGEITISSPSMMLGYWANPEATQSRLQNGWLRTGDLGLILDGELFVTGRKSDLMIVAGRNLYPHDVERVVAAAIQFDPHRVCVFAVREGATEQLVVAIEARGAQPDLERQKIARQKCEARFGSTPKIVVCRAHAIPRTSSGKLRRKMLARTYSDGDLPIA